MNTALRNVKKSAGRGFSLGWLLPLVMLALPNCAFPTFGLPGEVPAPVFEPGDNPTEAIFCEIPKPLAANDDGCATQSEADNQTNISLAEAATALVTGEFSFYAFDYSDDAQNQCGGRPKKINYFDEFPEGTRVCINCGTQMPNPYPTMVKACVAKCQDLVNQNGIIPNEGAAAFCEANARLATNHDPGMCYKDACTGGGNPIPVNDPRKRQEEVVWIDTSAGVEVLSADHNSIKRTALATMPADFNEGAGSEQTITKGDGWVEFEAGQTGVSHVIGLRESCEDPANCPDSDHGLTGIGFAISLNSNNNVYVLESGNPVVVEGPFGAPYSPGERFRVRATANSDGKTATITYARLANCKDDVCASEFVFWTSKAAKPSYPLRVDAIFREENATLENVTIVRIKK